MTPGIRTTENWRGILLIALAAYCVHKGYTPDQITDAGSAILAKWQQYQDTIVSVVAISAALLDNLHYTRQRTRLKQSQQERD